MIKKEIMHTILIEAVRAPGGKWPRCWCIDKDNVLVTTFKLKNLYKNSVNYAEQAKTRVFTSCILRLKEQCICESKDNQSTMYLAQHKGNGSLPINGVFNGDP